jgi:hypothetical protein
VPHRWLADNLSMGKPSSVQSWVSNKREDEGVKIWLQKLQNHDILDFFAAQKLQNHDILD